MRACAVEMHLNFSQKPLFTEMCRKTAAPQIEPRTRARTLCELALSKCRRSFHKSHFIRKCTGKCRAPNPRPTFCASPRSGKSTFRKSHFIWNFRGKMLCPRSGTHTLCEPAHSKCTSTFEKGNFIRKFIGKMVETRVSTLIKHRPLHLLQEPLSVGTLFGEPATWKMQRALANRNVIK